MASPARSFSETEKRNLLAEIIKISDIPAEDLLEIILKRRVEPEWDDIVRPAGHALHECKQLFGEMKNNRSTYYNAPQEPHANASHARPATSYQVQTYSTTESTPVTARNIQPRPATFQPSSYPPNSFLNSPSSTERQPKKRGRPSNADLELRRQEAAARGEPWPPPRPPKRSKGVGGRSSLDALDTHRGPSGSAESTHSASPTAAPRPTTAASASAPLSTISERAPPYPHDPLPTPPDRLTPAEPPARSHFAYSSEPPRAPPPYSEAHQHPRHLPVPLSMPPAPSSSRATYVPLSGPSPTLSKPASALHLQEPPSR